MKKRHVLKTVSLFCAVAIAVTGCGNPDSGETDANAGTGAVIEGSETSDQDGNKVSGAETSVSGAESSGNGGNTTSEGDESSEEPVIYGEPGQLASYDPEQAHYTLRIDTDKELHEISDMLYGIFF